jgi:hypothetical protein
MMKNIFSLDLYYVKIYRNKFIIENVSENTVQRSFSPSMPFTTERLLVGEFSLAVEFLKNAIKSMFANKLMLRKPAILLHPMEMISGGLCEVEHRLFQELALAAGGHKVVIWTGEELSKVQVKEKLDNA